MFVRQRMHAQQTGRRSSHLAHLIDDLIGSRHEVVAVAEERLPRRGGVSVLELPAGSLARSQTRPGDRIALEPVREEGQP